MRFLLLNQTFYPDVMATGQYLGEVAVALVQQGHEVTVVTSRRAYDDPARIFPKAETWKGVRILRIGSTGFGKANKWRRAADFGSFLVSCAWRVFTLPRQDVILALTSPPLISVLGAVAARWRRSRFVYWVMDFNPDEAIAAGWLRAGSLAARLLDRMSRLSLRQANRIIALDRFMRDRIVAKGINREKIVVLPPWAQDKDVQFDSAGRERFRKAHGLEGKFVVMYSGNHSPCHPLDTLVRAAERLNGDRDIVFCFIGGGSEWRKIKAQAPSLPPGHSNVLCLPYQPLSDLSGSLSAADLHVVVMGDPFVGLVHPCKIYNILSVNAPVLYIGPGMSHITDLAGTLNSQFACARHGDVAGIVQAIQHARCEPSRHHLPASVRASISKTNLLPRLLEALTDRGNDNAVGSRAATSQLIPL